MTETKDNKRGRPVKNIIEPIRASPEKVAMAIMKSPPKKDWRYLKNGKKQ